MGDKFTNKALGLLKGARTKARTNLRNLVEHVENYVAQQENRDYEIL